MQGLVKIGGWYYFRRAVPPALVGVMGCREVKKSLKTDSYVSAVKLARLMAAEVEVQFTEAKILKKLDKPTVQRMIGKYYKACLEGSEKLRTGDVNDVCGFPPGFFSDHAERLAEMTATVEGAEFVAKSEELIASHIKVLLATGRFEEFPGLTDAANALLAAEGLEIDRGGKDYGLLLRELAKVQGTVARVEAERFRGDYGSEIEDRAERLYSVPQPVGGSVPKEDAGPLLSEVMARFLAQRTKEGKQRTGTAKKYHEDLGLFVELRGDRPVNQYTHPELLQFRDQLERLPANMRRSGRYRKWSMAELLAMEIPEAHRLDIRTVNNRMSRVAAVFAYAYQLNLIPREIGQGLQFRLSVDQRAERKREPFTPEDLRLLFFEALPFDRRRPHDAWLPLLGLFTGCREGELCQLKTDDVREVDEVWCFDILTQPQEGDGRLVKGRSSQRLVPLHPALIEVGFLEFVARVRLSGKKDLFAVDPHYYSQRFTKIKSKVIQSNKKVFHSFRHTLDNTLKQADVPKDKRDSITGHAPVTIVEGMYTQPFNPRLKLDALIKVGSFGLDVKGLKRKYKVFLRL